VVDDCAENTDVSSAPRKLPTMLIKNKGGSSQHEYSSTVGYAVTPANGSKNPGN